MSDDPEARFVAALRRWRARECAQAPEPAHESTGDWQKFIEAEMGAFNRRLARIEIISLILLVLVVVTDASKAADLLQHLLLP